MGWDGERGSGMSKSIGAAAVAKSVADGGLMVRHNSRDLLADGVGDVV